jgi:hypothetical protein
VAAYFTPPKIDRQVPAHGLGRSDRAEVLATERQRQGNQATMNRALVATTAIASILVFSSPAWPFIYRAAPVFHAPVFHPAPVFREPSPVVHLYVAPSVPVYHPIIPTYHPTVPTYHPYVAPYHPTIPTYHPSGAVDSSPGGEVSPPESSAKSAPRDAPYTPSATAGVPGGSYAATCTGVTMVGTTLQAACRRIDGQAQQTFLVDVNQCVGDIGNLNGILTCNRE